MAISGTVEHATAFSLTGTPPDGANAWNGTGAHTVVLSGTTSVDQGGTGITSGTSGGVLYFSASGTLASSGVLTAGRVVLGGGAGAAPNDSGNLIFSDTAFNSAPGLTLGSGTTTLVGWKWGYAGASGYSAMWPGAVVTPGASNYILQGSAAEIYLNAPSGSINFRIGNTQYAVLTAGQFSPGSNGTETLGVTGNRWSDLFLSGACTAASYTVGAAAGASFGPGLPTSITIVNGIVTAAS